MNTERERNAMFRNNYEFKDHLVDNWKYILFCTKIVIFFHNDSKYGHTLTIVAILKEMLSYVHCF